MKALAASLFCLFALQVPVFAQSSCVLNSSGSFSGRVYTNTTLGISYTYPESFTLQDSNLPSDKKGKSSILFALWKSSRDMATPSLVLFTDDPSQYSDTTALGYVHRIENTVTKRNAKILGSAPFDIAGVKFYRLDYQFASPDNLFNTSITGQIGKCEVSFEIRAATQPEIEKLVQSVKMVKLVAKNTR